MPRKMIGLRTTSNYPCQWDDLIDKKNRTRVTIYTLKEAKQDGFTKEGIYKTQDEVYNIIIATKALTRKRLLKSLLELSAQNRHTP